MAPAGQPLRRHGRTADRQRYRHRGASQAGDHGIRGFVAAFKPDTGCPGSGVAGPSPARGEPGIETWQGKEPVGGGGSHLAHRFLRTPSSDTLYWPTGNPWPDSDDRDPPRRQPLHQLRPRAQSKKPGEIKWHYQFTGRTI